MQITALQVAQKFVGVKELDGLKSNPLILGMLQLDTTWVQDDQTPWCSAYVNFVCHLLGLPRSRSLAARSWLTVGSSIPLTEARPGFDLIVLKRGKGSQPGPEVIAAPGHVGFYVGQGEHTVEILGGNQGNAVSIAPFPKHQILKICRLHSE